MTYKIQNYSSNAENSMTWDSMLLQNGARLSISLNI